MKKRQEILTRIVTSRYSIRNHFSNSIDAETVRKSGLYDEVNRIYRILGGILDNPPLSFGKWDICLDGFIVELDEEQHFNRYRAITLDSHIYHVFTGFDTLQYKKYCNDFEIECLNKSSWGKYWTSSSPERQFGLPDKGGILNSAGSPRWKQRAYYDYLRDVYSLISGIKIIRLSVYDSILINNKEFLLTEALSNYRLYEGIIKFISLKVELQ